MSGYEDDSQLKAQKKMLAMQKRVLALQKKQTEARPEAMPEAKEDISVFEYLDRLENDINLTRNDLDEYMNYRGTAARNLPSMYQITPLSRKILSVLKKVNFKNVPESDLQELTQVFRNLGVANASLATTVNELNQKGVGRTPREKDEPFRRLYEIVKQDIRSLFSFVGNKLSDVGGHNYLSGLSAPPRRPTVPQGIYQVPPAGPRTPAGPRPAGRRPRPPAGPPAGPPPAGPPPAGAAVNVVRNASLGAPPKTPRKATPKTLKLKAAGIPKRFL
jgi:hypothetical protein